MMRISILIFCIVHVVTGSALTYYKRFQENDNKTCHTEDTVITNDSTSNEAKCLGLCSLNSACRSIFVNTDLNLCYGCSRMYDVPTGLPSSPGTKHFEKPGHYMDSCTVDKACGSNQGCYDNKCRCKPGFPFNSTSNRCVTECAVYGSDFQAYPYSSLNIVSREEWGLQFSPDACRNYCATQSWCRAFDHSFFPISTCAFKDQSAATNSEHLGHNSMFFHYSRNCA